MNKEETAQKIVDIFFNKGAKVSKKEYNEVLEILENYISKQEVKEKISVKIQSVENRRNMLIALAESGYMASVEEVYDNWMLKTEYYVVFEIENANKDAETNIRARLLK